MTSKVVSRDMNEANVYCLSAMSMERMRTTYILLCGRDTDGIGYHQSSHLLVDGLDLVEWQYNLIISDLHSCNDSTYIRDPAKDVCMKADMVFRDIQSSLNQNIL